MSSSEQSLESVVESISGILVNLIIPSSGYDEPELIEGELVNIVHESMRQVAETEIFEDVDSSFAGQTLRRQVDYHRSNLTDTQRGEWLESLVSGIPPTLREKIFAICVSRSASLRGGFISEEKQERLAIISELLDISEERSVTIAEICIMLARPVAWYVK